MMIKGYLNNQSIKNQHQMIVFTFNHMTTNVTRTRETLILLLHHVSVLTPSTRLGSALLFNSSCTIDSCPFLAASVRGR